MPDEQRSQSTLPKVNADETATSESSIVVRQRPPGPPATPSLVPPSKAKGVVQGSRRWIFIARHELWVALRSKRWWFRIALTVSQIYAFVAPLRKYNVSWRDMALSFGWILATHTWKAWKQNQPQDRRIVETNYDQRKLAEYKLVHAVLRRESMTPPEVETFQRDVLDLIAMYVRDHRRDWNQPTIFANLLVERGDELEVIARDFDHRQTGIRYPRRCMLAARVFETGEPALTGDLYRDYPDSPPGKNYASILAVPVHRDKEIVGVVTIDSPARFHFDLNGMTLANHLRPYVALLSWTLQKRGRALYIPQGVSE